MGEGSLRGLFGRPYLDLGPYLGCAGFDALDDEICLGLCEVATGYTGGSHRSMGIMPPSLAGGPYLDYGEAIAGMGEDEFRRFCALGEAGAAGEPSGAPGSGDEGDEGGAVGRPDEGGAAGAAGRPGDEDGGAGAAGRPGDEGGEGGEGDEGEGRDTPERGEIGEEGAVPLSRRQMLYLKYRYGVYFPWKVFYQFIPTNYWHEKSSGAGKAFTAEACALFPKTVAFVRSLPFREIGRCNLMGLEANDEGTVHRDGDPAGQGEPDHFITFCPGRREKRLFLWGEAKRRKTFVRGRAYWFNDFDYHGVEPDPYFRYSIRVDGVFEPSFVRHLERALGR
ncbi:MAG TPA: hypothetical protein VFS00_10200, partial [Polyangiaceae bacterium]|nr:hypothetical protein [Polyangiaceae bacterium]